MKIFIILVSLLSIKAWAQDGAKSNLDCPFKTLTSKEDQDVLGELQNYFKSFSNTPSCNQASMLGLQTVADLQSALSVANSSEEKCHSQNLEQTKLRDQALASIEKDVEIEPSSSYGICNVSAISKIIGPTVPKDRIIKCITDKFQSAIQECKNVPISESVQDKVTKGIEGLEKTLTQTLSEKNLCSPKMKEALKMAMSTYSKVKPLASFLPWGSVTGVGTDLVESVVDNFFPSDAQRASTIMDDLLSDDSYEKIACLYFNIQQEMYCSSDSGTFENSDPRCNKNSSGGDLVKLLANIHEIKNATNTVLLTDKSLSKTGTDSGLILDTNYLEARIDDFIKYAKSSEEEIRNRIKTLPKIQQAHEREKINYLYHLLDVYQLSNTETTVGIKVGNRALEELMPLLYSSDPSQRINFEQLIVKSNPGLKTEVIKQRGIIKALEELQNSKTQTQEGRKLVRLNQYKKTINETVPVEMKRQLEKKYSEFKNQLGLLLKKNNGVVDDLISEGMLRNIVRHCTLMQEVYDPQLEGKIPDECAKINCGNDNRLNWFMPKEGQINITQFKKSYCEKSINYKKIEDEYIKELKGTSGPKMCGKNISEFL